MSRAAAPDSFEQRVARILLVGVVFSAVCLVAGLALWIASPDRTGGSLPLKAGLFTLMAIPVLRIAFSLAHYIRIRDWPFAATAAAVLGILATSVIYAWKA